MVAQRRVLSPGHSAPRQLQIKVVLAQDPSDRIESMLRNLLHPFFVDLVAVTHELRAAVPITLQAEPSGEARQLRLAGWQAGRQAGRQCSWQAGGRGWLALTACSTPAPALANAGPAGAPTGSSAAAGMPPRAPRSSGAVVRPHVARPWALADPGPPSVPAGDGILTQFSCIHHA